MKLITIANILGFLPLQEKKKITLPRPAAIAHYNATMGGDDLLDANISNCRTSIRGKKWYYSIFLYLVDVACVNAWVSFRLCCDPSCSYNEFRSRVAVCLLAKNARKQRSRQTTSDIRFDTVGHLVEFSERELRCKHCNKNTKFRCVKCCVNLHAKNCFILYHTR